MTPAGTIIHRRFVNVLSETLRGANGEVLPMTRYAATETIRPLTHEEVVLVGVEAALLVRLASLVDPAASTPSRHEAPSFFHVKGRQHDNRKN